MAAMADFPESHRDLLDAHFATLATVEPDGLPQLSELWFIHDDGDIKLSLNAARRAPPQTTPPPARGGGGVRSFFFLVLENPFRYLEVRGTARIEPDRD